MVRSFPVLAAIAIATMAAACSTETAQQQTPLMPEVTVRTATMNITPGMTILAGIKLPDGFDPSPYYPPLWLQSGKEVAVAGTRNGHTVIIGYSGKAWQTARVIAEDGAVSAADGRIVDLAASPDGMTLALAVAVSNEKRLDVVVRDIISAGGGHPVSSFDGEFDSVSLQWLNEFTIALGLRARTSPPQADSSTNQSAPSSGVYLIGINGMVTAGYVQLNCKLSQLNWAPEGNFGVAEGDSDTPAFIVDRQKGTCQRLNATPPVHVLDWSDDGTSFLYAETNLQKETATYRYDVANQSGRLVAISSGAAAFVGNGNMLALGSGMLTFRKIVAKPMAPVRAELALIDSKGTQADIESLGFNATAEMLAKSIMSYSGEANAAAIVTFSPTPAGPMRKLLTYSVTDKSAFQVAFGPARGPVTISWSPRGRYLAIVDGDSAASALTLMVAPR